MNDRSCSEAELRATLAAAAVPDLSPGFEARLHRRLEESAAGTVRRRDRYLLAAYWTLAGAASLAVLSRLDWSWHDLLVLASASPLLAIPGCRRLLVAAGRLMYPPPHDATPGDA